MFFNWGSWEISGFDVLNFSIAMAGLILGAWFYHWKNRFEKETREIQARPVFSYVRHEILALNPELGFKFRFDVEFRNVGQVAYKVNPIITHGKFGVDQYNKDAIVGPGDVNIIKCYTLYLPEGKSSYNYQFFLNYEDSYGNKYNQEVKVEYRTDNNTFEFWVFVPKNGNIQGKRDNH